MKYLTYSLTHVMMYVRYDLNILKVYINNKRNKHHNYN